jgi:hypothetical protein
VREWAAVHRIGWHKGGRWVISAVALDMLTVGDTGALGEFTRHDRTTERVIAYYRRRAIPLPAVSADSADFADAKSSGTRSAHATPWSNSDAS